MQLFKVEISFFCVNLRQEIRIRAIKLLWLARPPQLGLLWWRRQRIGAQEQGSPLQKGLH